MHRVSLLEIATNSVAIMNCEFGWQTAFFDRGFGGGVFRHYNLLLSIPLLGSTAKTTNSADKGGCG